MDGGGLEYLETGEGRFEYLEVCEDGVKYLESEYP
jgi:hypothetical protein